jgi:Raf kinase inhibitor-like YbhB/YbcL family protein
VTSGRDRIRRRRWRLLDVRAAVAIVGALLAVAGCGTGGAGSAVPPKQMPISSLAFTGGTLDQRYTCHGAKMHPPLNWSSVPAGTKSLALIVDDSSAPITPSIYWLVFDIGPGTTDIQEGSLPTGARQGLNSAGTASYDAPCPQGHPHMYRFTIYALRTVLKQPSGASLESVWTAIAAATIGRGRIVVTGNP